MNDNKLATLTFSSSLTEIKNLNPYFDTGMLRIGYHGKNRLGMYITKEAFMNSIESMYYCPVVCNYDRTSDTFGGHDMAVSRDADGQLTLINLTQPVGFVLPSNKVYWELVTEENGEEHEYLCCEVLLWKRQEAYKKIKRDGVVSHSMEIEILDSEKKDGLLYVYEFRFKAFALLGIEPCFESSCLDLNRHINFSLDVDEFKSQLCEMKNDIEMYFNLSDKNIADKLSLNNAYSQNNVKGGNNLDKNELIISYNFSVDDLDFSIDELSYEELEEKLKAMKDENSNSNFALTNNLYDELVKALEACTIKVEWSEDEIVRYLFVDFDTERNEVYCWDKEDWNLYGFKYSTRGDTVDIDFESKKRKKYDIVDFDEGNISLQSSPFIETFSLVVDALKTANDELSNSNEKISSMSNEVAELQKFKNDTIAAQSFARKNEIINNFSDLNDIQDFKTIKENLGDMSEEVIEEKCFALRGRHATFLANNDKTNNITAPKLPIEHTNNVQNSPYGGIFEKYGIYEND